MSQSGKVTDQMPEKPALRAHLATPWAALLLFLGEKTIEKALFWLSCLTCWCPCITFGRISEIVDKGSSSCGVNGALYFLLQLVIGCACCYSCFYRSKMRKQFNLEESPWGDCLVHCFCEECALCQEYRELKSLGFDVALGNFK
ncbi:hypothetical protein ACOSQ4_019705 [Xanthoceras sorbifolium]